MESKFISTTSAPIQLTATKLVDQTRAVERMPAAQVSEPSGDRNGNLPTLDPDVAAVVSLPLSETALEELVLNLNDQIQATNRELRFSVDKKYGRPIVTVIDKETEKVIRQIPAEVALQVADALEDVAGALVSERA
ncbi:MAG: flagellar protein FlaG [Gammaproteobacteria bacterium]|jgi:flagellar protein FlaG